MIPRTIPKNKFIGESVAEASFIASKGIDETKAPTQRDAVSNLKNLEVNYDGSVSPRCPLVLKEGFLYNTEVYTYLGTLYNGDYLILVKNTQEDLNFTYNLKIINKENSQNETNFPDVFYNSDLVIINTTSSTIIQNCILESGEIATFKLLKETSWKLTKMTISVNTIEFVDGNPQINPNLMLEKTYSYRDVYGASAIYPLGIVPYIKVAPTEDSFNATVDNTDLTTMRIKDLTESDNFKIIESIPKNPTFSRIYLKCFINNIDFNSTQYSVWLRWEKTADGIYWEDAELLTSGNDIKYINVPDYVSNKSVAETNPGVSPKLFKRYAVSSENDLIQNRPDILILTSTADLHYSYRVLMYILKSADEVVPSIHTTGTPELTVDGANYEGSAIFPAYSTSLQRNFIIKFPYEATDNYTFDTVNDVVFSTTKFSMVVTSKGNGPTSSESIYRISSPTEGFTITLQGGKIVISATLAENALTTALANANNSTEQLLWEYNTKISIYFNNIQIGITDLSYKDVIQIVNTNNFNTITPNFNASTYRPSWNGSYYTVRLTKTSMEAFKSTIQDVSGWYKYNKNLTMNITIPYSYEYMSDNISNRKYYCRIANDVIKYKKHSSNSWNTYRAADGRNINSGTFYNFLENLYTGDSWASGGYDLLFENGDTLYINSSYSFRYYCFMNTVFNTHFNLEFTTNSAVKIDCRDLTWLNIYSDVTVLTAGSNIVIINADNPTGGTISVTLPYSTPILAYTTSSGVLKTLIDGYTQGVYPHLSVGYTSNVYGVTPNSSGHSGTAYDSSLESEALALDGFQVGLTMMNDFLRNASDNKFEVLYLDLGANNANKGYKLYWNHRIVSYGAFKNNILFSDSDSLVTPLLNTLTLNASQDSKITSVVPWRNYLIASTAEAVYLIYEMDGGFGHKAVNTFIGIPNHDRRTCKAILNGIIFKSSNKIYTLQPGLYSNDDSVLNIAEISQPIENILSKVDNASYSNFAISTSKYYYLFTPGHPVNKTTCFKYDYVRRIWTTLEFPVIIKDYIQTTEDELYLVTKNNAIFFFEKDFTDFVKDNPNIDLLYADYLEGILSPPTQIQFELDSGQKTDNISTTKQFVETKMLVATMDNMDAFPLDVDIYIDGIQFKNIHTDINTDGAVLKRTTEDGLILGTNTTTDDIDLKNTFRQLILRYSGKGKSIRHIISGSSMYDFKIYVTYYRYKLTHNKQ